MCCDVTWCPMVRAVLYYVVLWCDVASFDLYCAVLLCGVVFCGPTWCDVPCRTVMWCGVTCCVVLKYCMASYGPRGVYCDVTWYPVIWRDVTWRDVMWRDVAWCAVLWCVVESRGLSWCDACIRKCYISAWQSQPTLWGIGNVIFLRDGANRRCERLAMLSFRVTVPTNVVSDWECYLSAWQSQPTLWVIGNVIFLRDGPHWRCEWLGMLSFCVTVPTDVVSDWQCYLSVWQCQSLLWVIDNVIFLCDSVNQRCELLTGYLVSWSSSLNPLLSFPSPLTRVGSPHALWYHVSYEITAGIVALRLAGYIHPLPIVSTYPTLKIYFPRLETSSNQVRIVGIVDPWTIDC